MDLHKLPRPVLLVEDDESTRYAMRHLLAAVGVTLDEARDALEAIDRLSDGPLPSCVLLDWLMPGGGGAAVLGYVRDHDLPVGVIVLTVGYERYRDEIQALRPHAVLPKPIDTRAVLAALKTCIEIPRAAGAPGPVDARRGHGGDGADVTRTRQPGSAKSTAPSSPTEACGPRA